MAACGCVHRQSTTAEVIGHVIDESSNEPIKGASIHWSANPEVCVFTKEDGSFRLPPAGEHKIFYIIPGDPVIRASEFVVEASGYMQTSSSTRMALGYQNTQEVEIKLKKEKPKQ